MYIVGTYTLIIYVGIGLLLCEWFRININQCGQIYIHTLYIVIMWYQITYRSWIFGETSSKAIYILVSTLGCCCHSTVAMERQVFFSRLIFMHAKYEFAEEHKKKPPRQKVAGIHPSKARLFSYWQRNPLDE